MHQRGSLRRLRVRVDRDFGTPPLGDPSWRLDPPPVPRLGYWADFLPAHPWPGLPGRSVRARDYRPSVQDAKLSLRWRAGTWLGKVSASDEHIVAVSGGSVAFKTRTVCRRSENERWSKEALEAVSCTPWTSSGKVADAAAPMRSKRYITKAEILRLGPTEGCGGCSGVAIAHTPACEARFERLWTQESDEKALIQPKAPAVLGGPAVVPPAPLFEPPTPPQAADT